METAILEFVSQYGLFGFMPGLPTTPDFMEYFHAYFPKNQFVRDDYIWSPDYVSRFFPFDDVVDREKGKVDTEWRIGNDMNLYNLDGHLKLVKVK